MKKLIYSLVVALLSGLATSCKDYLNVKSTTELSLDTYFTSYDEGRQATAALYNIVWYDFSSQFYFNFGDGRGNNLFTPYSSEGTPFINFTETIETPLLYNGWQSMYIVVSQADYAVLNLDRSLEHGVSQEQVNQLKAEARFMRGLAYWYLGSIWGNVPIVEDPSLVTKNFAVNTNYFEDVLMYAIRDMEFAAGWLPATDVPGRVTRYSAKGMLARFYITAACYARGNRFSDRVTTTADEFYGLAKAAAEDVIKNSTYKLMDDYEDLFKVQYNNNSESLFALQFVPGSLIYGTGNRNQDWLAYSTDLTNGLTAYGGSVFASGELVKLMHDRGEIKRKKATFFYPGAVYNYLGGHTTQKYWAIFQENDATAPTTPGNSKIRYPLIKKHVVGGRDDTNGLALNGNSGLAAPMLRLAEVYLLYAEAILGTNASTIDDDALKYVNKVRTRAGLSSLTSISLADLWDERRCELALEGQYWYDIVRRAYWDTDWVLNTYLPNQHRNEYYYYLQPNVSPTGFTWRSQFPVQNSNTPTADRLTLPYPAAELALNPLMRDAPIHFDFGN